MSRYALAGIPFLVALAVVLALGRPVIAWLASKKAQQPISPDAPEKHRLKHGTPTMGGLLILAGFAAALGVGAAIVPMPPRRLEALGAVAAVFLLGGGIGLLDDLGKARRKENKAGLSERAKLGLQFLVGVAFALFLHISRYPTVVLGVDLGIAYPVVACLCVVGFGNATNFTDGLDGLLSGTTVIVASVLALSCVETSTRPEMALIYGALAGGCAGFLWWNAYPARAFMGDTGSVALGMGLSAAALVAGQMPLFAVAGAVYLAEIGSMMLQRYVFKFRRITRGIEYAKAHRVFRRAPLHHHFEELGWHETQVVIRFWVVSLIAGLIGLIVLGGGR